MIEVRLFGITFGVSVGFFGVLSLMLYIDRTGLLLPALEATFLHELGHLAAMCLLGCRPQKIELKVGAVAIHGRLDCSLKSELAIAAAGPVANLVFFQIYFLVYYYFGWQTFLSRALVMLVMGVFHLLPIEGLDGGTLLYYLLLGRLSHSAASTLMRVVSLCLIAGLLLAGMFVLWQTKRNPSLILLAVYLLFGVLVGKKQKE